MFKIKPSEIKRLQYCIAKHLELKYESDELATKYANEASNIVSEWNAQGLRYIRLEDGWLNTETLEFERCPDREKFQAWLNIK